MFLNLVALGFRSGHLDGNLAWIHGGEVEMVVGDGLVGVGLV